MILLCLICMMATTATTTVLAQTTIQFGKPTRLSSQISSVTVPNNIIFDEINAFEAAFVADLLAIGLRGSNGITVNQISVDFPTPTVQLTGTTTNTVQVKLSGLKKVVLQVRLKLSSFANVLCFGFSATGPITIKDLSITSTYDYFTGSFRIAERPTFSGLDVNLKCPFFTPGFLVAPILELVGLLDQEDMFLQLIRDEISDLNNNGGRFDNTFSLQDALAEAEETGLREIRQSAEGALMILGGVQSAVACFIATVVTEEMIRRLGLTAISQIDQLRRLLSTLPDFIVAQLPNDDAAFVNGNLVGAALQAFLTAILSSSSSSVIQSFLLTQLNTVFAVSVAIVRDIELVAIEALCNIVKTDFNRLIGGVNARLAINRLTKVVTLDGFHTGPASFVGRAEATIPCHPTYVIPAVENAVEYMAFNSNQRVVYSSTVPTNDLMPHGLLTGAQVQGPWGLYSYVEYATIQLIHFHDCGGCTESNFQWPRCPVGGEPMVPTPSPPVVIPQPVPVAVVATPVVRLPPGVHEP